MVLAPGHFSVVGAWYTVLVSPRPPWPRARARIRAFFRARRLYAWAPVLWIMFKLWWWSAALAPTPAPTSKKRWWRRLPRTELLCPSLRCRKTCHLPLRRGPPWGPAVAPPCLKESGGRSLPPASQRAKRPKWLGVGATRHWLPPLPPRKPVTVGGEAGARPGT